LQRVDVMMIPIDAMTNLGLEDIMRVIDQVKPPIVIPMHYRRGVKQGELVRGVCPRSAIRCAGYTSESELVLSRVHAA
jgi:hypothetical protein